MSESPQLRVSDADRERVVDELRRHAGDGRLEPDELDERLTRAYAARTAGDLRELTADLPPDPGPPPTRLERFGGWDAVAGSLAPLIIPNVAAIGIWALSGGGKFWPAWVLLVTGVAAIARLVKRFSHDGERSRHHRRDRSLPPPPKPPGLP